MIGDDIKLEEVPFYDIEKLAIATNNFALSNKLGQGGFGPVYKVGSFYIKISMRRTSVHENMFICELISLT